MTTAPFRAALDDLRDGAWRCGVERLHRLAEGPAPVRSRVVRALARHLQDTPLEEVPTGGLAGAPELAAWLARALGHQSRTVAARIDRLAMAQPVGTALVALDGERGALVRLHVGWEAPSPIRPDEAVRDGYAAAQAWLGGGGSPPALVELPPFWVEPLTAERAHTVRGPSVGLGAAAAWVSLLTRQPLPHVCVWTGQLALLGTWRVHPVDPDTLTTKVNATRRLLRGTPLICPDGNREDAALDGILTHLVTGLADAAAFLPEPSGPAWLPAWTSPAPDAEDLDAPQFFVLHLLAAAGTPLPVSTIEAAFTASPDLGSHTAVEGHLRTLEARSWIRPTAVGAWELAATFAHTHAARPAAAAHRFLATRPDQSLSAWLERMLHAHRLAPDPDATDALRTRLADALENDRRGALRAVHDACLIGLTDELAAQLSTETTAGRVASLLTLLASAPAPVRSVAPALLVDDDLDLLLGLQATFEASLHVVQAAAAAAGVAPGKKEKSRQKARARFSLRPNIGELEDWLKALQKHKSPDTLPEPVRAVHAALFGRLSSDVLESTVRRFNQLHAPCSIADLRAPLDADPSLLDDLLVGVTALVQALVVARSDGFRLEPTTGGAPAALSLPGLSASADREGHRRWFFARGTIDGAPRQWAFDRAERLPVLPLPEASSGHAAPGRLPRPLALRARAVLRTRPQSHPPLAVVGAIDRFMGLVLRLAVLPLYAHVHSQGFKNNSAEQRLQAGGNHRLYFRALTGDLELAEPHASTALGRRLLDPTGRAILVFLIDGIERLQHAPGPVSEWSHEANRLHRAAVQLLRHLDHSIGTFAVDGTPLAGAGSIPVGAWTWHDGDGPPIELTGLLEPDDGGLARFLVQERTRKPDSRGTQVWCPSRPETP